MTTITLRAPGKQRRGQSRLVERWVRGPDGELHQAIADGRPVEPQATEKAASKRSASDLREPTGARLLKLCARSEVETAENHRARCVLLALRLLHERGHSPDTPSAVRLGARCGAKTRAGTPCQRQDLGAGARCRMHGGRSSGPTSEEGKAKAALNSPRARRPNAAVTEAHGDAWGWLMGDSTGATASKNSEPHEARRECPSRDTATS